MSQGRARSFGAFFRFNLLYDLSLPLLNDQLLLFIRPHSCDHLHFLLLLSILVFDPRLRDSKLLLTLRGGVLARFESTVLAFQHQVQVSLERLVVRLPHALLAIILAEQQRF